MKQLFRIHVRRSILDSNRWGTYLVPKDQPDLEYQDLTGFESKDEAIEAAALALRKYSAALAEKTLFVDDEPRVVEGEFQKVAVPADKLAERLKEFFGEGLTLRLKLDKSFLFKVPILLAILGLLVFWFNFSIKLPKDALFLEFLESDIVLSSNSLSLLVPVLIMVATLRRYSRGRDLSNKYDTVRNYTLALILKHKWSPERIAQLLMDELSKIKHATLNQFLDRLRNKDPDAAKNLLELRPRGLGERSRPPESEQNELPGQDVPQRPSDYDLYWSVREREFERRIHGLLYLERERDFRPSRICVEPVGFLLSNNSVGPQFRAIMLARSGKGADAVSKYYQAQSGCALGGFFIGAFGIMFVMYGVIALALSLFVVEALSRPWWWLAVTLITSLISLWLPLQHLYHVYLRRRGYPRGFALWEGSGSLLVI